MAVAALGRLLVVNAGSSSLKVTLLRGETVEASYDGLPAALAGPRPDAVGHRVVHGGERLAPVRVDDAVLAELDALVDLAPLHQPPALHAIRRCLAAWPDLPQVACFDTTFHSTVPAAAYTYALPERLRERVRVYGFHGLSHAWSARRAALLVPDAPRVVVAHLGAGASLCAVLDGRSVATTMGFTPLDGLVMATRSGSLDPGAVLWLLRHGLDVDELDQALERESGLLGLCGTGDMREVLSRAHAGDPAAGLALEVYLHRLVGLVGQMAAALRGLDVLVFTGGVGEHAGDLRRLACKRLGWLGVALDPSADPTLREDVSATGALVRTLVVSAREDLQVAAEVRALLGP